MVSGLLQGYPKRPCTTHIRTLVPKSMRVMVFGSRVREWSVYGGFGILQMCPDTFQEMGCKVHSGYGFEALIP